MRVDDAVGGGQAQARRKVLELFPHLFGTGSFVFHVGIQTGRFGMTSVAAGSSPPRPPGKAPPPPETDNRHPEQKKGLSTKNPAPSGADGDEKYKIIFY